MASNAFNHYSSRVIVTQSFACMLVRPPSQYRSSTCLFAHSLGNGPFVPNNNKKKLLRNNTDNQLTYAAYCTRLCGVNVLVSLRIRNCTQHIHVYCIHRYLWPCLPSETFLLNAFRCAIEITIPRE